ncbi:MAG TPA: XrtA-associated tyrosine autokinase [Aquabacterium sp.]|nr:XrtA-associated tyrosine autokinase [Aquabacterium sp.]
MSSLIEQAARRLAQIRDAGIEIPGESSGASPAPVAASAPQLAQPLEAASAAVRPADEPIGSKIAVSAPPADAALTSRRVELDLHQLAAAGIVTPNAPRSNIADQYRVIKRPLIQNAVGKGAVPLNHGNLIMVTSAMSGEGKSYTSINLAMSIAAELDHTVMLVDADVARPSILRMLGLPPGPGLLDLLEGQAEMSQVLQRTNIDKLTLLPSGSPHPRATELLASDAMRQLLDDIATRYHDRIVIFDSPPLLLTTESRVLASHMGQIVIVVNAGKTLQADVQHALSTIESCPVRLMLLNKAQNTANGAYGYSYGYGYGYEQERQPG